MHLMSGPKELLCKEMKQGEPTVCSSRLRLPFRASWCSKLTPRSVPNHPNSSWHADWQIVELRSVITTYNSEGTLARGWVMDLLEGFAVPYYDNAR